MPIYWNCLKVSGAAFLQVKGNGAAWSSDARAMTGISFFLFWSPCLSTSDPHKLLVSRERSSHVWWPNTDCAASKHSHIWPNFTSPDYLLRCLACSRHVRPLLLFCFWRQHMPLDWMLDSLLCFTIVLSVILMCNQSIHGCVQSFILVESLFVLSGSMVSFFLRFVRLG